VEGLRDWRIGAWGRCRGVEGLRDRMLTDLGIGGLPDWRIWVRFEVLG
jgi:hypothetical protein